MAARKVRSNPPPQPPTLAPARATELLKSGVRQLGLFSASSR